LLAFFYNRETIPFGLLEGYQMSQLETSVPSLTGRSSKVRHVMGEALVYLGIAATFASVMFIVWLISLVVIW
jgi:hypothetical protein